jgi:thioredoxin 1
MTDAATDAGGEDAPATDRVHTLSDEDELDALVAEHPLVLVEFYTEGCAICASMAPVLDGLAHTTDAVVATVNPRDDPPLVDRFDVSSVPLLVLFVDGEPVARRADGFQPVEAVQDFVAENR